MNLDPFDKHAHLRFPGCDGLADAEGFAWDAHKQHLLFFRPPVLEGKVTVSGKIRTLESEQFSCREDIREVVLEDGVKNIGDGAFSYCPELVRVVIPESVGYIAANAFEGCEKLREILRPDGTPATEVFIGKAYITNQDFE